MFQRLKFFPLAPRGCLLPPPPKPAFLSPGHSAKAPRPHPQLGPQMGLFRHIRAPLGLATLTGKHWQGLRGSRHGVALDGFSVGVAASWGGRWGFCESWGAMGGRVRTSAAARSRGGVEVESAQTCRSLHRPTPQCTFRIPAIHVGRSIFWSPRVT